VRLLDAVCPPEVPVTVTVYWPCAAVLDAFRFNVTFVPWPARLTGFETKDAVTPLGSPEINRLTLPEKPSAGWTLIVEVCELPCPIVTEL
jgi:hypothetical protein